MSSIGYGAANEVAARTGIHLLGRRTYDVMRYWDEARHGVPEVEAEFQRAWASSAKVVYSRSIDVVGPRARIEREFSDHVGLEPSTSAHPPALRRRSRQQGCPGLPTSRFTTLPESAGVARQAIRPHIIEV